MAMCVYFHVRHYYLFTSCYLTAGYPLLHIDTSTISRLKLVPRNRIHGMKNSDSVTGNTTETRRNLSVSNPFPTCFHPADWCFRSETERNRNGTCQFPTRFHRVSGAGFCSCRPADSVSFPVPFLIVQFLACGNGRYLGRR